MAGGATGWPCISFVPEPESIHFRAIFWTAAPRCKSAQVIPAGRWASPPRLHGQFHDRRHVSAGPWTDFDRVGVEPRDHGRVHGIGRAERAEQEGAVRAVATAAIGPDLFD